MAASCSDNPAPSDEPHQVNLNDKVKAQEKPEDVSPVTSPVPKEPFMGNVNWCTPLPPDIPSHPIVKGMLTFDAAYENGR